MSRCHRETRPAVTGMTLVEVLVALALLGLLAVGILSAFRLGQRSYSQIIRTDAASWDVLVAQRMLRNVIENVEPFDSGSAATRTHAGLEGDGGRMAATSQMPQGIERKGFYRYEFAVESHAGERKDWVVRARLDRDGEPADVRGSSPESATNTEVILKGIQSIEWSYFGPPETTGSPLIGGAIWRADWSEPKPPLLVRVRVRFPPGDRRVWPEFMARPHVTVSATCLFDAVSQKCRAAQP